MTALETDTVRHHRARRRWPERLRELGRPGSLELLVVVLFGAAFARGWLADLLAHPVAATLATTFVSIVLVALPFLVLGAPLSAAVTTFLTPQLLRRLLPETPVAAVPVAGVAGAILPTDKLAAVPTAAARIRNGVAAAAALTLLLAAPALSPVVLVATAVAFPAHPEMVAARFFACLTAAVVLGLLWLRLGRPEWLPAAAGAGVHEPAKRWDAFWESCRRDVVRAGGFLVLGAFAVAALTTLLPPRWLAAIAASPAFAVVALALLAVLFSVSSAADAFVVAALSQFSLTARLAFLVVGPLVDLRQLAAQIAAFGTGFAVRFAPVTFAVAVLAAVAFGSVML